MARPTHLVNATSHLPDAVDTELENQRDNDTDRYVLAAQSRQVAGAAERKARAQSPSRKPAYPPALSQQAPVPDRRTLRPNPDGDFAMHFHAARRNSAALEWCLTAEFRPNGMFL